LQRHSIAHVVFEVIKCLWLGYDELPPEQRHRVRSLLEDLRSANPCDRAAVTALLAGACLQLALVQDALEATDCHRSARKVWAVLNSVVELLREDEEKVVPLFPDRQPHGDATRHVDASAVTLKVTPERVGDMPEALSV
jgi:hypothetical protein